MPTPSPSHRCCGTTKRRTPCLIHWDLDKDRLCKYHRYKARNFCRATKSDGTRCEVAWDLDSTTKLCKYHKSSDPRSSRCTSEGLSASEAAVSINGGVADKSAKGATTETDTTTSPSASSHITGQETRLIMPPLWTARYIVSTRVLIIRFYSEWSRQCHHEPIMLKLSRWGNCNATVVNCSVNMAKPVPVLGGFVEGAQPAMKAQIEQSVELQELLEDMNLTRGGLFTSDGNDHELLESLLLFVKPKPTQKFVKRISGLRPTATGNDSTIWVTDNECEKIHKKTLMRQPKPADASMHLLFERVTRIFFDDSAGTTIHWKLTYEDSVETIEAGIACVNEPAPITKVKPHELHQCELTVEVHKTRWLLGELSTSTSRKLQRTNRDSEDLADNPEPEPLRVGCGGVIPFRFVFKTAVA